VKFLLEIASEEIPARMQAAAADQLRTRFVDGLKAAGLAHGDVVADATPRRLWLIADDVAPASAAQSEERKGPAATAPDAAIAGFLRSTGLARDQLEERDTPKGKVLFALIAREGRPAAVILADLVPQIVRDFAWPKSMRWGAESATTASPRWVRPLTGLVVLLDGEVVSCAAHGVASGRVTRGHRIHAPAPISIDNAATYAAQLRAAHVIVASAERRTIVEAGAAHVAAAAGLSVIPDAGLVAENAGLTEWPVPMLGGFDPSFLAVPREVIQLTMRTNQKYFALADAGGALAPNFVCVANLEASDGGTAIVAGNERVLSARLSDAKFFWDQDVKAGLESFTPKLANIVFHEKLGTVADKVDRVAALARWLVESGAITSPPAGEVGLGAFAEPGEGASSMHPSPRSPLASRPLPQGEREALADLAERAARLCKADLVSATVGEFPEVQGIAGRYLALAAGEDLAVADAIRDHYKPVGQGDEVPTAPVSAAVALADKLDTLVGFFLADEKPTGSRDPFALRRAALGVLALSLNSGQMFEAKRLTLKWVYLTSLQYKSSKRDLSDPTETHFHTVFMKFFGNQPYSNVQNILESRSELEFISAMEIDAPNLYQKFQDNDFSLVAFLVDRLKVQQREAGVRHDLIDAVFALGGEDDLVRLLARVKALQAFVATDDGVNLLAGYKRAANILKIESAKADPTPDPSREREGGSESAHPADVALSDALNAALPTAEAAVAAEDFAGAMAALAGLRAPVDAFFADVMVNDPDPVVRAQRLALLARFRDAVHKVADFSRIEG
jgi:glycyl-tRNA synthetase beta chain